MLWFGLKRRIEELERTQAVKCFKCRKYAPRCEMVKKTDTESVVYGLRTYSVEVDHYLHAKCVNGTMFDKRKQKR